MRVIAVLILYELEYCWLFVLKGSLLSHKILSCRIGNTKWWVNGLNPLMRNRGNLGILAPFGIGITSSLALLRGASRQVGDWPSRKTVKRTPILSSGDSLKVGAFWTEGTAVFPKFWLQSSTDFRVFRTSCSSGSKLCRFVLYIWSSNCSRPIWSCF